MAGKTLTPVPPKKPADGAEAARAFLRGLEIDVLARTIWGEARGESKAGQEAVASVILNRVRAADEQGVTWWGHDIISVCQKRYQFSCWNKDDPNYTKMQAIDGLDLYFATCLRIARRAVYGQLQDRTHGATHYHAAGIMPSWAVREKPVTVIGNHIFYRMGV